MKPKKMSTTTAPGKTGKRSFYFGKGNIYVFSSSINIENIPQEVVTL